MTRTMLAMSHEARAVELGSRTRRRAANWHRQQLSSTYSEELIDPTDANESEVMLRRPRPMLLRAFLLFFCFTSFCHWGNSSSLLLALLVTLAMLGLRGPPSAMDVSSSSFAALVGLRKPLSCDSSGLLSRLLMPPPEAAEAAEELPLSSSSSSGDGSRRTVPGNFIIGALSAGACTPHPLGRMISGGASGVLADGTSETSSSWSSALPAIGAELDPKWTCAGSPTDSSLSIFESWLLALESDFERMPL
mmetsp:Transcript_61013/g.181778  ORF Transcript_61013/g.181778 Transcript_61013/m.181778 type:complete len:249 (-) Transcript_61013:698-1444(-)